MKVEDVPSLLPARMLNEYVYCPRLFYLEWVDDRFADNDDTVAGRFAHRAVDRGGGRMPDPDEVEWLRQARQVRLESEELGLVAVIDRIENNDGSVVPVDVKKGRPTPDGGAWPADVVQVAVHGLLLREYGYTCDKAVVYYAETKQRVDVDLTDDLLQQARELAREAHRVAGQLEAPLPLIDSPKCPRCSLVGLCMPDETNALLARSETPPRRLLPRDPDHRPLYVTEPGSVVGVRGGRVNVTREGEQLVSLRLIDVSQVSVFGNAQVTTQALTEFFNRGVPVLWFSFGGWLRGWATGPPPRHVELRRKQVLAHAQGGLGIAREMIGGKVRNARTLLRRNARENAESAVNALGGVLDQIRSVSRIDALLGLEGTAARIYFSALPSMLSPTHAGIAKQFSMAGRTRRPPTDPVNALLSYAYALLLKDIVAILLGVGLDPYLGVLHRPRFGRPALALDLAEEFRPLIADSVVVNVLNNGELNERDFIRRAGAVTLTPDGRRTMIKAYERRLDTTVTHPVFKYKISYRRVMDVQARILAAVILGEIDQYVPMTTR